ncbi:MAG TPA: hypothetical protein VF533_06000 [Solirubrobacteraceae bacterium]|jgi:hypothetical protein
MPELLAALQEAPRHCVAEHPAVPDAPGIYLFRDGDRPICVGQSRRLRTRLKQHTGAKRGHNQASFAFSLAKRKAAGANVDIGRFRAALETDPKFVPHFDAARARVASTDVQFIEVPDPIVRTLFEVYASLTLDTVEFNSFETH